MTLQNDTLTPSEREQKIAVCSKTYANLYGHMPDLTELCRFLGADYLTDIMMYLRRTPTWRMA